MLNAHAAFQDIAKVTHQGHVAHLAAVDEFFPCRAESKGAFLVVLKLLLAQCRQLGFPSIGNGQALIGDFVEECLLRFVFRLGVDKEKGIAQLYFSSVAVVFGELVFIEAVEGLL